MDHHVFVVARDQGDLCTYLQREFSTEETVAVILDRRQSLDRRSGRDRRAAPRAEGRHDRRAAHRRGRPFVDSQVRSLGYAMLRIG